VVLVPLEGLDLGPGSMGPAIDHEGDDTGLDRDMVSNEKVCYIWNCSSHLCLCTTTYDSLATTLVLERYGTERKEAKSNG
jgi:hypothetical protein